MTPALFAFVVLVVTFAICYNIWQDYRIDKMKNEKENKK